MADDFGDARLAELKLLAELDRRGGVTLEPREGPERDMVFFLVYEQFATAFDLPWRATSTTRASGLPGESELERHIHECWVKSVSDVLEGQTTVHVKLTHKGRVRLSELRQALAAGRIREQYGILWDGRHVETDLQIAILDASENSPLSVGYLDLNGLKQINDGFGHEAGDVAVRTYFQAISTVLADRGQAYRVGGDEVIAILPSQDSQRATETMTNVCRLAMGEEIRVADRSSLTISVSVGIATTTDARKKFGELRDETDKAMYRAKQKAKESKLLPSAIYTGQGEVLIVPSEKATGERQ